MSEDKKEPPEEWISANFPKLRNPKTIGNRQVHPAADVFPAIYQNKESDEWKSFLKDIEVHGQIEPITVYGAVIIDGRNRAAACLELNRHPYTQSFEDMWRANPNINVYDFIRSKNIHRRDLTKQQKAFATTRLKLMKEKNESQKAKEASLFQPGNPGGPGGDRKSEKAKSSVRPESGEPLKQPRDHKKEHERSTAGKLAAEAGCSRHQINSAMTLLKLEEEGKVDADTIKSVTDGKCSISKALAPFRKPRPKPPFEAQVKAKLLSLVESFKPEKTKEEVFAVISKLIS